MKVTLNKTYTLTSNGFTGQEWIEYFENCKYNISSWAKELLRSPDFKPSPKQTEYDIIIVPAIDIPNQLTTDNIRKYAKEKGYIPPPVEVGCLIRDMFTDKEIEVMGLWYIMTMHEPIKDSDGDPGLLGSDRDGDGRWLYADYGRPDGRWDVDGGFAFVVPQVSALKSDTKPSSDSLTLQKSDVREKVCALIEALQEFNEALK